MKTMMLLAFQFVWPVLLGFSITCYLRAVTIRLLTDVCGTLDRAEFWARVAAVVTVCMPLMFVLLSATSPLRCVAGDALCGDQVVRQTFVATLVGSLLSVASVAVSVALYLPHPRKSLETDVAAEAR